MFKLIVIAAVIACTYAAPFESEHEALVPMLDGRIVGGSATSIENFPWTVTMQFMGSHRCGGSIITPNRIVTAAHCTVGTSANNHAIRAGSTQRHQGGQLIQVTSIRNHAQYNPSTLNNDISTMWLAASFNTNPAGVSAVRVPNQGETVTVGANAQVTGWGALSEGGPSTNTLQVVTVPIISNAACNAAYGGNRITPQMLCAGFAAGGRDACQGDSGGPLTVGNTLVGIVSWGNGCARPGFPGVYVRVGQFRTWINANV